MTTTELAVTELTEQDRPGWDGYVKNLSCGLPTHLSGWRDVMSKFYDYETHYLMARRGEKVVGVLPMFIVRSVLVGDSAMTMPGGLCADSCEIAQALIDRGQEIARQLPFPLRPVLGPQFAPTHTFYLHRHQKGDNCLRDTISHPDS